MSAPTVRVWMGLGEPPRELTRQRYRALCATWAGEEWDMLHAAGTLPLRPEDEIQAEAADTAARVLARYAQQPQWTPADAEASRAEIVAGRDPRRIQAAILALR